jgi:hypothetical protein
MTNNDPIFNKIAEALLVDYSSVYYVNAVTNEYVVYSLDPEFSSLKIDFKGVDFFKQLIPDCEKVVHPDDRHVFTEDIQKEKLCAAGIMAQQIIRIVKHPDLNLLRLSGNLFIHIAAQIFLRLAAAFPVIIAYGYHQHFFFLPGYTL